MKEGVPTVPPPEPPAEGWYAPQVLAQREVHQGVVTTVRDGDGEFVYETRTPELSAADERALERVDDYLGDTELRRPRTREGVRERMDRGFEPKYDRAIDRLTECSETHHGSDATQVVTEECEDRSSPH